MQLQVTSEDELRRAINSLTTVTTGPYKIGCFGVNVRLSHDGAGKCMGPFLSRGNWRGVSSATKTGITLRGRWLG
jgi:hypothetical protein